jgi:hypothetical protein
MLENERNEGVGGVLISLLRLERKQDGRHTGGDDEDDI